MNNTEWITLGFWTTILLHVVYAQIHVVIKKILISGLQSSHPAPALSPMPGSGSFSSYVGSNSVNHSTPSIIGAMTWKFENKFLIIGGVYNQSKIPPKWGEMKRINRTKYPPLASCAPNITGQLAGSGVREGTKCSSAKLYFRGNVSKIQCSSPKNPYFSKFFFRENFFRSNFEGVFFLPLGTASKFSWSFVYLTRWWKGRFFSEYKHVQKLTSTIWILLRASQILLLTVYKHVQQL